MLQALNGKMWKLDRWVRDNIYYLLNAIAYLCHNGPANDRLSPLQHFRKPTEIIQLSNWDKLPCKFSYFIHKLLLKLQPNCTYSLMNFKYFLGMVSNNPWISKLSRSTCWIVVTIDCMNSQHTYFQTNFLALCWWWAYESWELTCKQTFKSWYLSVLPESEK